MSNDDEVGCVTDLTKLRFEYAWKHFEYHARQRITMFNFFLIVTGIVANAYVRILDDGLLNLATAISIIGIVISVGFFALDWRNTQLVHMGEAILNELEKDNIFKNFTDDNNNQLGFIYRERLEEVNMSENFFKWFWANSVKHKIWIRGIEIMVAVLFLVATILSIWYPDVLVQKYGASGGGH